MGLIRKNSKIIENCCNNEQKKCFFTALGRRLGIRGEWLGSALRAEIEQIRWVVLLLRAPRPGLGRRVAKHPHASSLRSVLRQIEQVYWSPCGAAPHKKHEIFAKKQLKSCTTQKLLLSLQKVLNQWWHTIILRTMNQIVNNLRKHQSTTPSRWRERANWREENKSWLRHSQHIAMMMLDKMEALGMTQRVLAERMGCSQQYVSRILKGHENLSIETMCKIEDALDLAILPQPE